MEEKKRYLEHHWVLAGKELDQEKVLRQKLRQEHENDHERTLRYERERFRKLERDYEKQIDRIKRSHAKHCEVLGKEIIKANLEADRLHNQFFGEPRKSKLFATSTKTSRDLPTYYILLPVVVTVSFRVVE